MVPMYKKGGKKPKGKSSFMEESKEIKFGDKPMMKGYGGMKYKKGGMPDLNGDGKVTFADVLKGRGVEMKKSGGLYSAAEQAENIAKTKKMNSMQSMDHQTQVKKQTGGSKGTPVKTVFTPAPKSNIEKEKAFQKIKEKYENDMPKSGTPLSDQGMGYKKSGNTNTIADKLKKSPTAGQGMGYKKEGNSNTLAKELQKKKTGGKSMEPGGGGRFAAMVSKLKGEGKSEGSAKAIAASIGRAKYGKSKFQEMAAKGKKGLGGMSDSTGANEAGMEMMEAMGPKRPKKGSSGTRDTGPNVKRTKKARKNIGKCNRGEVCFD